MQRQKNYFPDCETKLLPRNAIGSVELAAAFVSETHTDGPVTAIVMGDI